MARWSANCTVEELLAQRDKLREDLNALVERVGVTLGKTLV